MRKASLIWQVEQPRAVRMIHEGYACIQICRAIGVSDNWLRKKLREDSPSLYEKMVENGQKRMRKKAWETYPPALSTSG